MRRLAVLFFLLATTAQTLAEPATIALNTDERVILPEGSSLKFQRLEDGAALFDGRILLRGTYAYGDGEFNDGTTFMGEVTLKPDAETWTRLPRLQIRGRPDAIGIANPEDFARAVIPANVRARVERKGGGYATGPIAIWVDGFSAGISCDAPSFSAHFLSAQNVPATRVAASAASAGC